MLKNKKMIAFLIIMAIIIVLIPSNIVNAGITDVDEGASTNSKTTLEKKETETEEVSYDTNLEEYIANKKNTWINSLTSEPDYKDEWLSLYVSSNGIYKYPVALKTYFIGVTTSDSDVILVGDPSDLANSGSNIATYNYRLEYKEITVTRAENPYEIKNVNITLTAPTVGDKVLPQGWTGNDTENIVDDGTMEPDKYPTAISLTDGVKVDSAYWINGTYTERPSDWELLYFGTFKENTYYYAYINISALEGKTLNSNLSIKVNGEDPAEVFAVYNGENTHFVAKIKAEKDNETEEYTINSDNGLATAIFTFEKGYDFVLNINDLLTMTPEQIQSNYGADEETFNSALEVIKNNVKQYGELISLYEITIDDGNMGYSDALKLKLKLTDEMKKYNKLQLIYVDENNNFKVGDINDLTINSEAATGDLDHLSVYALVGSKTTATEEETTTTNENTTETTEKATETTTSSNPKTGDNIAIWISLMIISMLGIARTVKLYKKNK